MMVSFHLTFMIRLLLALDFYSQNLLSKQSLVDSRLAMLLTLDHLQNGF